MLARPSAASVRPALRLLSLPRFGSGMGLHRIAALKQALAAERGPAGLAALLPEAIKITGSNGKGSVAAMTEAILTALGISSARHTSPHLFRVEERLTFDGEPIPEDELDEAAGWALEAVAAYEASHPGDTVGAFEAISVAAFAALARRSPRVVVAEAGIGGRFDPTQALPGRLAALTSVELEHTALLGNTVEAITFDKADLCPDGGTLVTGRLDAELHRRLAGASALRGVRVIAAEDEVPVADVRLTAEGLRMDLELRRDGRTLTGLETRLVGRHQAHNAAVAVALVREWLEDHRERFSPEEFAGAVRRGLATAYCPGRFERRARRGAGEPELFADIGHTPGATAALADTVRQVLAGRPVVLLVGISEGRAPEALLAPLAPLAAGAVCVRPQHRGAPAARVAAALRSLAPRLPTAVGPRGGEDLAAGLEEALGRAAEKGPDGLVLVAGSYFLAAEALWIHGGGDPRNLHFF